MAGDVPLYSLANPPRHNSTPSLSGSRPVGSKVQDRGGGPSATEQVRILAVVVTFHPSPDVLRELLGRLTAQVAEVLVVDNGPPHDDDAWNAVRGIGEVLPRVRFVRLGCNRGIAHAFNVGLEVAANEGFSHVLLSDQDSRPDRRMVVGLLRAEARALARGCKVAAVGPVYKDEITGITFPVQVKEAGRLFYRRKQVCAEQPDVETLSLISSGTLIRTEVLQSVGGMLDPLFIDYVDVEWCLRAIARGYAVLATHDATMDHRRGDECLSVWFFGWRPFNGYGPTRLYYQFRNFVYLARLSYIPFHWKVRASWYWLGCLYANAVFGREKRKSLIAMFRGIADGARGRMGPT